MWLCPQIVVRVQDRGEPALQDISTLRLVVRSNFQTPSFRDQYTRTVKETFDINNALFNVTAEDGDLVYMFDITFYTQVMYELYNFS